ncbi:unnamed protein product [Phytophthora fragariaefolia]|uniref:Unnamed protein product n=1 Tax=Phytophthora fragariaefolia TaxID=1490495 RepID=A0A9W6WUV4_9STRA|nr:unnamed protein product [Phytophthora fragariaefolia]
MPVGACVEDERRHLIAMFDICKPLDEITEGDWINYFWEGRVMGELDFDKFKALVRSKLAMDTQLTDADSRVSKLAHEMYQLLEKENMEWMIEGEPKKMWAREPNKPLHKDVVVFIKWLRASCKEYLRWEPKSSQRQQSETKPAGKKPDSVVPKQTQAAGNQATRRNRTCLKCGSENHRIKDCPRAVAGEAEALLREWREKKSDRTSPRPAAATATPVYHVKALQLKEVPLEPGSECMARLENVLDLDSVLLDSGADVNVASRSLVELLRELGVALRENTVTPRKLETFDGSVFEVSRRDQFDTIQFRTTAGPLLLRNTPAWVFEQEQEKQVLVLSHPVMESLGPGAQQPVGPALDDAEWRTATPEFGLHGEDTDAQVAAILAERVEEAVAAGLNAEQVETLSALLYEYRDTGSAGTDSSRFMSTRKMFSIMTHRGIITPTHVLMGGMNAVAYCQHVVEEVFCPMLYHGVLAWLDDILGYAADPVNLLEVLERVLAACKSFGLKLHPGKCRFFLREAKWCGKAVSGSGVSHCPSRIESLITMPDPKTAGQLQQLMCAVNWMRQHIPQYAQLAAPLLAVADAAAKRAGGRKAKQLCKIPLSELGWNSEHEEALRKVRDALVAMVPLAHPDPSLAVCLYCDASQDSWGAICTQVNESDLSKPLSEQEHRPLAFLSGRFTGAQLRWPTIEKEAYAIVKSAKRLEYLLLRPGGFHLFTDHRNLVYMFNPFASDSGMQRYQADKLQRWSMTMTTYRYVIEHVRGSDNVWADMLSRWGSPSPPPRGFTPSVKQVVAVPSISPLMDDKFEWPALQEIRDAQKTTEQPDLRATPAAIRDWCWWPSLADDVSRFVRSCIHCVATRNGREPRPYGPAIHATKPNEVIHFDYLTLPEDEDSHNKYVLVVKDDFSSFTELYPAADPDASTCADALLQWFYRYGIVHQWVSDQGTHFKNEVIKKLAANVGGNHHFTTAYCPWANGTVEVANRLLLKCMRAVLSERQMSPSKWESVLGMVKAALNQQPSDKLGGRAPVTAFMSLPATTPLATIFSADSVIEMDEETLRAKILEHLAATAASLEAIHREVAVTSDRRRLQARARRAAEAKPPNFSAGDFVLAATVIALPNKLAIKWQGPKRVVRALTDWIFEVEDLNEPHAKSTHHVSRLRFYAEATREVTEGLLQYALHSQGGHCVQAFRGIRLNAAQQQWEVHMKWLGMDELENTWESYASLRADVPVLLQCYCDANKDNPQFAEMLTGGSTTTTEKVSTLHSAAST